MLNSQHQTSTNGAEMSEMQQKIAIREKSKFIPHLIKLINPPK
jgi:hypothetical protein